MTTDTDRQDSTCDLNGIALVNTLSPPTAIPENHQSPGCTPDRITPLHHAQLLGDTA